VIGFLPNTIQIYNSLSLSDDLTMAFMQRGFCSLRPIISETNVRNVFKILELEVDVSEKP
jgi:hypothetical protein